MIRDPKRHRNDNRSIDNNNARVISYAVGFTDNGDDDDNRKGSTEVCYEAIDRSCCGFDNLGSYAYHNYNVIGLCIPGKPTQASHPQGKPCADEGNTKELLSSSSERSIGSHYGALPFI